MKSMKVKRNTYWIIGVGIFILICLFVLLSPFITKFSYSDIDLFSINTRPDRIHFLGTDDLGRDVLSRLLYGTGVSLLVGISSTILQIIIGSIMGILAGYFGEYIDFVIMRIIDVLMCFPFMITAMAIASLIGPSLKNLIIIIAILSWTEVARIVRAQILSLKKQNFILVAKTMGFSDFFIIIKHILPNIFPLIIVAATISMASAILMEASLSFLGLGVKDPMPSLGNILSNARNMRALQSYPWTWLPAGILIMSMTLAINFIGEGFRILYTPRQKDVDKILDFNMDIKIEKAKILAIVGESGSGKSVSMKALLGLNPPNIKVCGKIEFENKNLLERNEKIIKKMRGRDIVLMFQEPMKVLNPLMSVGSQVDEVLRLQTKLRSKERKIRVLKLFEEVKLENSEEVYYKYAHELSGGMRQRVQLAIALAGNPRILIADEPTSSVDENLKDDILDLLKDLCKNREIAIILITHDFKDLEKYVDNIVVMHKGEIIESSTTKVFFENPQEEYSRNLLKAVFKKENFTGRFYEIGD